MDRVPPLGETYERVRIHSKHDTQHLVVYMTPRERQRLIGDFLELKRSGLYEMAIDPEGVTECYVIILFATVWYIL